MKFDLQNTSFPEYTVFISENDIERGALILKISKGLLYIDLTTTIPGETRRNPSADYEREKITQQIMLQLQLYPI